MLAIEQGADADRERGIERDVTERQSHDDGNTQGKQPLPEHVFERLAVLVGSLRLGISAVLVDSDGDSRDLREQPRVQQLRQHPVKPVRFLVEVFKKQDRTFE